MKELDKVNPDTPLEDVVKLVSAYYEISPKTYFQDIFQRYEENEEMGEKIDDALIAFDSHVSLGVPLEIAIHRTIAQREKTPKKKRKKSIDYDHGLKDGMYGTKTQVYSNLVTRVVKAAEENDYVIPRTFSTPTRKGFFDIFETRLFIVGYCDKRSQDEVASMQRVIDTIRDSDKKTILAIDCKEGSFPEALLSVAGKLYPPINKYLGNVEIFGIDNYELLKSRDENHENYQKVAEERLRKTIIDNIKNMYKEYPDHNIVDILNTDISLEKYLLYVALEDHNIPYMVMFPRRTTGWSKPQERVHMDRMKRLAQANFTQDVDFTTL